MSTTHPPGRGEVDSPGERARRAGGLDHHVVQAVVGRGSAQALARGDLRVVAGIERDLGCAHGTGPRHRQEADRAAPDDSDPRAGTDVPRARAVPGDGRGLDQRGVGEVKARRQVHEPLGRCAEPLRHAAVDGVAEPSLGDPGAQVVVAAPAPRAGHAAERRLDRHPAADRRHPGSSWPSTKRLPMAM